MTLPFTRVERSAFFTGFEAFVSGVEIPTELPRGVDIISTEFDSDLLTVEGVIENQQSTVTDLEVLVTGYNGDWLTYTGRARASNVPPETTWRYQLFLDNVAPDDTDIDDDIELYVW